MGITTLILMTVSGMLSVMPLLRIDIWGRMKRYRRFSFASLLLVLWGYVIFMQLFGRPDDVLWLYQSNHLMLMMVVFFFFYALRFYRTEKSSPILLSVFFIFFLVDLSFLIIVPPKESFMRGSSVESLFILADSTHSYVRYFFMAEGVFVFFILSFVIVSLMVDLFYTFMVDNLLWPAMVRVLSYVTCLSIVLLSHDGLIFGVDIVYLSIVILIASLYGSFLLGDPSITLRLSHNKILLDKIGQMYIIADTKGNVIQISANLKNRFDIEHKTHQLSRLIQIIKEDNVLLEPGETIDFFDKRKTYYLLQRETISFPLSRNKGILLLIKDITRSRRMSYEMDYVMNHDLMTGLHNRNYFESIKPHIERHNETYALILMDLDGLKVYNDILGHKAGDRLIKRFASAMTNIAEKYRNTLTIRLGGDEFLLLPQHKSSKEIQHMIDDLKQLCHSRNMKENIGFSYGIEYKTPDTDESISSLLGMADEHLYKMKAEHAKKKEELRRFLLDQYAKTSCKLQGYNKPDNQ